MSIFKEAGKIETRIKHWARKRDEAIDRASDAYNSGLRKVLLQAGPEVANALVHQGLVHKGFVDHLFGFQDAVIEGDVAIEADAGPGLSVEAAIAMADPAFLPR